jgi:predicted dehydrogenase
MQHGLHVFTEKPMCLSSEEGMAMTDAAARAGRVLMVGYMKRYDPAYARLEQEVALLRDLRLVRVTTLESPIAPYVAHYQLHKSTDVSLEVLDALRADDEARVERAIGTVSDGVRHSFRWVLLDSLVHELNLLRGVLGEPTHVTFADLGDQTVTLGLDFSGTPCVLAWVDLPGIARYQQEFAFFSPERRVALTFPSPFLRNMPTELSLENGELGTARSWRTVETTSYHEAFKCELAEFYSCITQHRQARTSGEDGLRDVQLCETIVACHEARHSARKAEAKRRGD